MTDSVAPLIVLAGIGLAVASQSVKRKQPGVVDDPESTEFKNLGRRKKSQKTSKTTAPTPVPVTSTNPSTEVAFPRKEFTGQPQGTLPRPPTFTSEVATLTSEVAFPRGRFVGRTPDVRPNPPTLTSEVDFPRYAVTTDVVYPTTSNQEPDRSNRQIGSGSRSIYVPEVTGSNPPLFTSEVDFPRYAFTTNVVSPTTSRNIGSTPDIQPNPPTLISEVTAAKIPRLAIPTTDVVVPTTSRNIGSTPGVRPNPPTKGGEAELSTGAEDIFLSKFNVTLEKENEMHEILNQAKIETGLPLNESSKLLQDFVNASAVDFVTMEGAVALGMENISKINPDSDRSTLHDEVRSAREMKSLKSLTVQGYFDNVTQEINATSKKSGRNEDAFNSYNDLLRAMKALEERQKFLAEEIKQKQQTSRSKEEEAEVLQLSRNFQDIIHQIMDLREQIVQAKNKVTETQEFAERSENDVHNFRNVLIDNHLKATSSQQSVFDRSTNKLKATGGILALVAAREIIRKRHRLKNRLLAIPSTIFGIVRGIHTMLFDFNLSNEEGQEEFNNVLENIQTVSSKILEQGGISKQEFLSNILDEMKIRDAKHKLDLPTWDDIEAWELLTARLKEE